MNDFSWAIIGTGFIYPRHKEAIERNGGRVIAQYNTRTIGWQDVLKLDVENVAICTPNDLHFEMAKACLLAGKRVLVEKPMVIKSEHIDELKKIADGRLFGVLQLRYHPFWKLIKPPQEINKAVIDIRIHRDESYFKSWKGEFNRSGGILYNIGSHYFDIINKVLGEYPIEHSEEYKDYASGFMREGYAKSKIEWHIFLRELKESQQRIVQINDFKINFSAKDNLSYEGLHYEVYRDIKNGGGITLEECEPSLRLIEKLNSFTEKSVEK